MVLPPTRKPKPGVSRQLLVLLVIFVAIEAFLVWLLVRWI